MMVMMMVVVVAERVRDEEREGSEELLNNVFPYPSSNNDSNNDSDNDNNPVFTCELKQLNESIADTPNIYLRFQYP